MRKLHSYTRIKRLVWLYLWARPFRALDKFFQSLVLRLEFRYLLFESRTLRAKLLYLSKRNRELKRALSDTLLDGGLSCHSSFPPGYAVSRSNAEVSGEPKR